MSDHRLVRSLGVEKPGQAYFFEYDEAPPVDGQVRLDTLYTGFSAGTELTFLKATNPYLHASWDAEADVFVEGEPSARFPLPFLGYMEVARVSDCRAAGFAAGDLVGTTFAHKTGHIADPRRDLLVRLPPDLEPILGIYVAQMGPIAANGILHADAERNGPQPNRLGAGIEGRPVLVIGAGVVGILTALFAQTCGASDVIIADSSPYRREKAEAMGIEAMTEELAWRHVKARWHDGGSDRGVDFVFQTRARSESLHAALRALRPQGTVIDLAFYQGGGDRLRLGEEFHHNGLSIRCAQINRVPRGLERSWDRRRLAHETVHLLRRTGDLIREHMITHEIPLEDAPAFLARLLEIRPDFLQIVFRVAR